MQYLGEIGPRLASATESHYYRVVRAPLPFADQGNHSRWSLAAALILALALHAVAILALHFSSPARTTQPAAINVVLIQGGLTASDRETANPSTPEPRAASSAVPATANDHFVAATEQEFNARQQASPELTAATVDSAPADGERSSTDIDQQLSRDLPQGRGIAAPAPTVGPTQSRESSSTNTTSGNGRDYAEMAKTIASSQLRRELDPFAASGRARSKRLTNASADSAVELAYLKMWQQKVERVGRANYPPGRIAGELSVLAIVDYDGSLREARILDPSGHTMLDEAALRIVRLAAPFSHFPTELHKDYDRLEIVRRWRFEQSGRSPR